MVGTTLCARRMLLALGLPFAVCIGIACDRVSGGRLEEGRRVAESFLEEVRGGRTDQAWQSTTVEFKSLMGSGSLRDYVRARPVFRSPAEYVDARPLETGGGRLVEFLFRATPPPPKGHPRKTMGPQTIRVMVDFGETPARVERLAVE